MTRWIDTNEAFQDFCLKCAEHKVLAIDTEFEWTSTYYANLALVQIGWDSEHCALVDALVITQTEEFRKILEDPSICKVFHEAGSDLPILYRWCHGIAQNIFDTRLAAAFCGLTQGCSLSKLIVHFTGVQLTKTETRSDWMLRPLTAEQLEYAADDIKQLPFLREKLESGIRGCNNWNYFLQEMAQFSESSFYEEVLPEEYWRKLPHNHLDSVHLAVLKEVSCWRETLARELNKARPRILSDSQIIEVVYLLPKELDDLKRVKRYWPKLIKNFGPEILKAVQRGLNVPVERHPKSMRGYLSSGVLKSRASKIATIIKENGTRRSIDPILIGSKKDAVSFIDAVEKDGLNVKHKLVDGWRKELLGSALKNLACNWGKIG